MKTLAPAKINLGLRILGKRPDGYHNIETTFARIGLHDTIELSSRSDDKIVIAIDGAAIPSRQNIVWHAAWLLQKFSPQRRGVNIFLQKRIPLRAGLGGGSSDAAAVLRGLRKFWQLNLPLDRLRRIALTLGADVPFFLSAGVQHALGRGEVLQRIELPKRFPREVLLVMPDVEVSTKWAYANVELKTQSVKRKTQINRTLKRAVNPRDISGVNDFEQIVFRKFPELKKIKSALKRNGAKFASLSGSGAAIFGLFSRRDAAEKARPKLEKFGRVWVTRLRE